MSPKCLLSYLLIAAAAIIPLPSQTLAQKTSELDVVLNNFDLLLLQKHTKDEEHPQSILLITERTPSSNVAIQMPKLEHESEYYERVTPDVNSDTVYWSTSAGVLGYFRVRSREFGVVYRADEHKITDLTYASNRLYWIEDATAIKSMQLGTKPEILVEERDKVIRGLTVDNKTGTIYYSTTTRSPFSKATIWTYATSSRTKTPIATDAPVPTSMSISDNQVYWTSNPPGMYFFIERLTLNESKSKVIVKEPHQHGSTIAVTCDKVLWTNSADDRVWVADRNRRKLGSGKQLGYAVLGESSGLEFVQVESMRVCNVDEVDAPTIVEPVTAASTTRATTSSTTSAATTTSTTQTTSTESMSSSSESVEADTPRTNTQIRVCTMEERGICVLGDLCVVVGGMKPICLSQQPPTQQPPKIDTSTPTPELNSTAQPLQSIPRPRTSLSSSSWPPEVIIIISVLSTLATVMSLISLYMTIRVRTLSRKPIIRRRVVVSTRTSESGSSSPASVCEMIDIENCCNMNVCETPCYERTLLQPNAPNTTSTHTQSTTQNGSTLVSVNSSNSSWGGCGKNTKEDKRCLLR